MAAHPLSPNEPNPAIIFDTLNAYQRSASLKTAIELDLFTQIARGHQEIEPLATAVNASQRGTRILCDYLVVNGLLSKQGNRYSLGAEAATFLDRNSPAYMGTVALFLLNPSLIAPFSNLLQIVRTGTTTMPDQGTVTHDNPLWIDFANQMAPMVYPSALEMAELLAGNQKQQVLDLAAGHGLFGIAIAAQNPAAQITAVDWPGVLAVATANAAKFGVASRHRTLAGDAFTIDFGTSYDLVLVTNFFHHFDPPTCEGLMRKIHIALAPGGRCATLDFIPNEDRVSPPAAAAFSMMMLGTTPAGDVYTFAEYEAMFRNAGFASSKFHPITSGAQSLVITTKAS